ncbi:MAG: putative Ig domain-containing protein [Candidatus Thiodiazotropha sp. L084R]
MKSLQVILSAFALSLVLSACGGSSDPESNETAGNAEDETAVSSGGETSEDTSDQGTDQNSGDAPSGDQGTDTSTPVVPPTAPVAPEPTKPADPVTPTNPVKPTNPTQPSEPADPAPDESADTAPPADNADPAPEEPVATTPSVGAAQLNSATVSADNIVLNWIHDFDTPEGGYDVIINGLDMGTDRTMSTVATISGLDLAERHCFIIEARYTDIPESRLSNEVCTEAQAAANQAPTISGTPAASVDVGVAYSFSPVADDADNDTLTFSVTNLPAWASFNRNNGSLSGTPSAQDVGDYNNIRVSVSDGTDSANLSSFSIRVNSVQVVATTGSMSLRWTAPTTRTDGSSLNLSEINGYHIYIGTSPNNLQMHVDLGQGDLSNYTVDNLDLGDYYVAIAAYDRTGNTSDLSNTVQKSVVN